MQEISIIFAYRNRDLERIKICMDSLSFQSSCEFEVVFVDYGSEEEYSLNLKKLFSNYKFVKYHYLETRHQLWNKSRALNYGIKKAKFDYLFIADVDLIFSPEAVQSFAEMLSPDFFYLFTMGYLSKEESLKLGDNKYENLKAQRFGEINGMILASKNLFFQIRGYDEFFHFYGSEDVDLYTRLRNAGYTSKLVTSVLFLHNWHISYEISDRREFGNFPRLRNARRINEQHYFYNKRKKVTIPVGQAFWGEVVEKRDIEFLSRPTVKIQLSNILAEIEHFFFFELPSFKQEVVEVIVNTDPFFDSLKYKIKKQLNKQSQIYCSLQDVNDIILKMIIFNYRNSNYSYEIAEDLKSLKFVIQKV